MSNTYEQFREIISLVATRNVFSCFQILTRKNNNYLFLINLLENYVNKYFYTLIT